MNVDPNTCLICERPIARSQWSISETYYECPRCGRYSVTQLGTLNLKWKENNIPWSEQERALLSGCFRSRKLRDEEPPRFLYASKRAGACGDFAEDILATAPHTADELVNATLANLAILANGQYGQWFNIERLTDLSLAYAATIDEADQVYRDLQREGLIDYQPLLNSTRIQITLPGRRRIERLSQTTAPPSASGPTPLAAAERAADINGQVTFGIITIREDEFAAVLQRLQNRRSISGSKRLYEYAMVPTRSGAHVGVAVARSLEQGHLPAQTITQAFIEELNPAWLLLVGIAGAIPSNEFTLGDVLLTSRLHNFAVTAALEGRSEFSATGGPMHQDVERLLAHLPAALEDRLGPWYSEESIGQPKPMLSPPGIPHSLLYGQRDWRRKVSGSLKCHFSDGVPPRLPRFHVAATASSNTLVKDTELAKQWLEYARHIGAIEMELGGVYEAARHAGDGRCRVLGIRGISDIIGYRRSHEWTGYACNSAAAFTNAFIRSGVTEL
jgi:nucleoside phosphorylase